jgi:hypothetical protein
MTRIEAQAIAQRELDQLFKGSSIQPAILDEWTQEEDFGWVFFYESRRYVETKNPSDQLVGNAPIIIDRRGRVHSILSSEPPDIGIQRLRESGALRPLGEGE